MPFESLLRVLAAQTDLKQMNQQQQEEMRQQQPFKNEIYGPPTEAEIISHRGGKN